MRINTLKIALISAVVTLASAAAAPALALWKWT